MIDTILQRLCHIPYRVGWMAPQQRLGHRSSRMRGEGLEFDQIRESQVGEGIRKVNWAATARCGARSLLVNAYYEEKDITVMLLVDLSASMDFGSTRLTKKALAAEIGASLVYSALACHDRVGLIGFTSDVACYVPPRQARNYQWTIPETLLHYDSTRTRASFLAAAMGLDHYLKRRALVFLLSDFLSDDVDELRRALEWIHSKHDLVSLVVRDPREAEFPLGHASIVTRDLETGERAFCSFSRWNRRQTSATAQARQTQLEQMFHQLNIRHVTVTPDSNYGADLTEIFLTSRGRQSR